jgi:hypothetical protein
MFSRIALLALATLGAAKPSPTPTGIVGVAPTITALYEALKTEFPQAIPRVAPFISQIVAVGKF